MRSIFFLIPLIFAFGLTSAQNKILIDSLKTTLEKTPPHKQFELLNAIGWEYRFSNPDSTIHYCQKAYELGKKRWLSKGLAKPLNFISVAYTYLGNPAKAYEMGLEAIKVATSQKDSSQLAHGNNTVAKLLIEKGVLSKAVAYIANALRMFNAIGDQSGIAFSKATLADMYLAQRDFARAEQALMEVLAIRLQLKNASNIASTYARLGIVYQSTKELEKSNSYFLKSDSVYQTIGDAINLARTKIFLAENYLQQGRIPEAKIVGEKGTAYLERTANLKARPSAYLLLGNIYLAEEKYHEARRKFTDALVFSKSTQQSEFQLQAYLRLAEVGKKLNDKDEEIKSMNQYLELKDSIEDLELARDVERLQFELDIEAKETELLKLRQSQTEDLVNRQRVLNIMAIVMVVLVSILAVLFWQIGKRRKLVNQRLAVQNDLIRVNQTEIDKQNEVLYKRNQELSDINHEKDTLMSIVAHDLKAPLHHISGLAFLIQQEGPLLEQHKQYLQMIREATRSGEQLIADLIDAHAMQEKADAPAFQEFDLSTTLNDSMSYFQVGALGKGIRLEKDIPDAAPFISDPNYINRIIQNLLSNAIKFSNPGSSVFLVCKVENDKAVIKIKDEGPGFTDSDKASLYKKFKKLTAKPTSSESSNGLGLAIVKILVDRLDGVIELESAVGMGSEFTITIPLAIASNLMPSASVAPTARGVQLH